MPSEDGYSEELYKDLNNNRNILLCFSWCSKRGNNTTDHACNVRASLYKKKGS